METVSKPDIEFYKKRSFGDLIHITIDFIRVNFKPLIKNLFFLTGPILIIISGIVIHLISRVFTLIKNSVANEFASEGLIFEFVVSGLLLLLVSFFGVVLLLCISKTIVLTYQTDKSKLNDVNFIWSKCREDFWRTSLNYFASFFVIILPFFLLMIPVIFIVAFIPLIGQLFAMFVSALFSMFFILTLLITLYENKGIVDSIGRSFTLLKDSWVSSAGFYLVINIMANIISFIFIIPLYVVMFIYMFHNIDGGNAPSFELPLYLEIIISVCFIFFIVLTIILYSFQLIGMSFQYYSLVETKESKGLLQKIDTIGTSVPDQKSDDSY
ncbi:MAG: hypothetical protein QY309_18495 [Cyclobacteriaceae bacterium]|nr:MAG: hypothetical protein QY309_18495 [Cyclobacteriaceae bacterium]